jgi:hypothetical protein
MLMTFISLEIMLRRSIAFKHNFNKPTTWRIWDRGFTLLDWSTSINMMGSTLPKQGYAAQILAEFGLENCNPVMFPMTENLHFTKDMGNSLVDAHLYQHMVGKLNFLLQSRPNIGFVLGNVSQFCTHPQKPHLDVVKHIYRYVKGPLIWAYSIDKERIMFCLIFGPLTKMIGDQQLATLSF